jgi:hypothetical protein
MSGWLHCFQAVVSTMVGNMQESKASHFMAQEGQAQDLLFNVPYPTLVTPSANQVPPPSFHHPQ